MAYAFSAENEEAVEAGNSTETLGVDKLRVCLIHVEWKETGRMAQSKI